MRFNLNIILHKGALILHPAVTAIMVHGADELSLYRTQNTPLFIHGFSRVNATAVYVVNESIQNNGKVNS